MNGYELGLTMFVIDYFAMRNEREEAEAFIEYAYLNLNIDCWLYKVLSIYIEKVFKNKEDK